MPMPIVSFHLGIAEDPASFFIKKSLSHLFEFAPQKIGFSSRQPFVEQTVGYALGAVFLSNRWHQMLQDKR